MTTESTRREAGCWGRTWLFVPGTRADRFPKAAASGADRVVLDLEDAVEEADKEDARRAVAGWLGGAGSGWVRVNGVGTPWHDPDLSALAAAPGLRGIVLPKAEDPAIAEGVRERIGRAMGVVALVETAVGVRNADALAASEAVDRLAFGAVDLANDLGAVDDGEALTTARSLVVLASRAAGRPAPIDGVSLVLDDPAALQADAARSRRLGFGGKLCVHPGQVAPVAAAFVPTDDEVAWARAVVAQAGSKGAVRVGGQMVDKPVVERARSILRMATTAG